MDFADLLQRYFATSDIAELTPAAMEAGTERMLVDLGMEKDSGKRFALWSLLYMLGEAPDLEATFKGHDDREAARNFMDMMASIEGEST
ncbi:hypothetical protein [Pontixanthobacter sp. CEM42]|uniref:hypothetical protein n=1 Tax=Pontixanthobacter sp. CEM42 TaxID=2792077 RepID=UPI001ADF10A0|nr:hypothetical protein [Pontixanthobacter sp. CEM42]